MATMTNATPRGGEREPDNVTTNLSRYGFALVLISCITVVLALTLLTCGYLEAWHLPWFEERYAPSVAIAHGQGIYRVPPDGPLMVSLYAPLSYLAFLPTAILPTVRTIFAGGSFLATAFLAIPLVLVACSFAKKYRLLFSDWAPMMLLPLTAIASLRPLSYIATLVTADAPSTCLMALSVWFLYRDCRAGGQPSRKSAVYSSLALALSLGCKQNMVFAAVAVIACVFYFFGRKFGGLYLILTAIFGILGIGLVIGVHHDIRAIYFNSVLVGLRFTVIKANLFPGAYRVFENTAVLGLILVGMWLVYWLTKGHESRAPIPRVIFIFFVVAATLSLSDIRFYAVLAGDVNDLSHGLYFFVLGLVVFGFELLVRTRSNPNTKMALRILVAAGALTLVAAGLPTRYNAQWKTRISHTPSGVEAYEFDKQNPGQVYFPFNAIGVYLAEHRFYTTEWGVMNLEFAKQQFTRAEILKFIPEKAQYVAMPRDYLVDDPGAVIPYVAPHRLEASVPGLENFVLYRIER
jgi:hypothetical protein